MEKSTVRHVLNYHLLPTERWEEAQKILAPYPLPHKDNGFLSVAEHDSKIRGIVCCHPVFHFEPVWIEEEYRGQVDIRRLQKSLTQMLPRGLEYYVFTPWSDRHIRWMAGTCGLHPMQWDIWKGVV